MGNAKKKKKKKTHFNSNYFLIFDIPFLPLFFCVFFFLVSCHTIEHPLYTMTTHCDMFLRCPFQLQKKCKLTLCFNLLSAIKCIYVLCMHTCIYLSWNHFELHLLWAEQSGAKWTFFWNSILPRWKCTKWRCLFLRFGHLFIDIVLFFV